MGGGTEEVSSFVKNSQLMQLERYISLEKTDKESCIGRMVEWLLLVLFFCHQTERIAHIEQRRSRKGVQSAQIKIFVMDAFCAEKIFLSYRQQSC